MEPVVVAHGLELVGTPVPIAIGEACHLWFLHHHDLVAFVIFNPHAEAFVRPLGEQ